MANPSTYFAGPFSLLAANACVFDVTPPVFGGITGLSANSNGSLTATWSAATDSSPPLTYWIYIQAATATGLFSTTVAKIVTVTTAILFLDSFNTVLTSGTTYYVGVRAVDSVGNVNTNTVSLSAVSQGVPSTSTNNLLNQLIATVGTPANTTVSADIAQVEVNAASTANGLDILFEVPSIEIPSSGTKDVPILIRFAKKALSAAVDPDSQIVTVTITNAAGSTVLAATNMTRLAPGVYRYDLNITNTFTPQLLIVAFGFTYLTVPFVRSQVIEALSLLVDLTSIMSTLGAPALASVSADIAAIETKLGTPAGASVSADIAQVETHAASADIKIGSPVNGTVTADIAQVEGHASSADSKIGTPINGSVSADIAQVETHAASADSKLGTPAGASVSADIAQIEAQTVTIAAIPTNPLLTNDSRLNNLDATISSRATQTSVSAIPTTPQLASVALSQYNALIAALGSIQNNTNFSGIVPQQMLVPETGSSTFVFYAGIFDSDGSPTDPDSNLLYFTVKDSSGNPLQAQTAMTRNGIGLYTGSYTVTAGTPDTDVVVFFNYSISTVPYQQVRTSVVSSLGDDSANIAAILAKTNNLPVDPASNTVVNTRASQTSVNAIPTNPALTTDSRFNNLDTNVGSRLATTSFNSTIGTPADGSVSADIAALQVSANALQESINNLGNNSSFDGIVPSPISLPDTGSQTVVIYARVFDSSGAPTDPDSNTLNITIKDGSGDIIVAQIAMARTGVGQYQYGYVINSTDPLQILDIFFDYTIASAMVEQIRTTQVAAPIDQQTNQLTTLLNRLTQTRADNLDYLDDPISSRAAASVLGTPAGASVSADIASIQAGVNELETATDPAVIADAVWNELLAGHTISGSAGLILSEAASEASPAVIAAAVWNAARASFVEPGSFGESNGFITDTKMSVAINPGTDLLTMMTWLEQNENIIASPTQATVFVYNSAATLLFTLGPSSSPSTVGVFTMTQTAASTLLSQNATYVALIQITQGASSYTSLRPFTVF